jgi:hypothetical protein
MGGPGGRPTRRTYVGVFSFPVTGAKRVARKCAATMAPLAERPAPPTKNRRVGWPVVGLAVLVPFVAVVVIYFLSR